MSYKIFTNELNNLTFNFNFQFTSRTCDSTFQAVYKMRKHKHKHMSEISKNMSRLFCVQKQNFQIK